MSRLYSSAAFLSSVNRMVPNNLDDHSDDLNYLLHLNQEQPQNVSFPSQAQALSSFLALTRRCNPVSRAFRQWTQFYVDRQVSTYKKHLSFIFRSKAFNNTKKRFFSAWFSFFQENVQEAYISHLSFMKRHMDVRHELRLIFVSWRQMHLTGTRSISQYTF
ncbi:hypothetical protein GUITHDRAFT_118708 [Guillardia theta CCMP2712]|uniref:Uncharacterized protein n=1 Tax=Guillardia theta (strain CCMP2712) TaxID=905079 RepID=L1IH55_GUITC|nr:hypothetical protein GUITHDRAFT_118708 [Guillardia theta CCMP2712]EKX35160.1 hypothetical protein GUITHDRAFT_118708 [Guillardia theta CCMP2712]|eukprot:XP_005822140.1 hypothetical protein GUITHDRAFT_118708 [Guillardia theta CCMP2712]